ncbi:hypothetical protein [Methylobacterium aquaticum]|jgi:hypothetical protein|uniref:Uncharacterized protein n=1 Tax=Methylobacterium aquaticum TaxID=270351 RepID=A0A0J6T0V5_9HYPH|nr:hypothetical protein [Methylobacterium aquaticum]KMO39609.1 hypothetical protein VP06_03835 [Methylobacterium aquaticum]
MPVREGGSYAADETGAVTRTGGTEQPDGHRVVEVDPAPEVPTLPAAPDPAPADAPTTHHPEA